MPNEHPPGTCPYCGRPNENNPGDHYHYHDCWRRDVLRRMETATEDTLPRLRRELEQAEYVGD